MAIVTLDSLAEGQQFVLQDGDVAIPVNSTITNDGSIVVATGATATIDLAGCTIQGSGKIFAPEGTTLTVTSSKGTGILKGVRLNNGGTLNWVGLLNCEDNFCMTNYGILVLDNPNPNLASHLNEKGELNHPTWRAAVKEMYPDTSATWILQQGIVKGGGVFHGNVEGVGLFSLVQVDPGVAPKCHGGEEMPSPSQNYITISGSWAQSSGVIDVTITATYYGQAIVGDTVTLGGCTCNVTLDGYTPAYTDVFRIIKAPMITGSVGTFNATALNFDNRGIITLTDGTQAYRLSGY